LSTSYPFVPLIRIYYNKLVLFLTEDELGQIVKALKEAYFTYKKSGTASDLAHMEQIETALEKIGWVIDEDQPQKIRTLRDYEL